ncbi:AlpA family phage regulatory protein [Salmonella enterica]|nr:AlpA family phage regulatory protein [Salmonella enterica]EHI9909941.1 AlpA family phage regulatory protein [Salmonella enterica]EHJ0910810.1 AlpA family phage regulatory protein [Salmonella enterica]
MRTSKFIPPTPEQRREVLADYGYEYEQRIREDKCKTITSLSRSSRWEMERKGLFPDRQYLGKNSCTWLLSDVLWWVRHPPEITGVSNPYQRTKDKETRETKTRKTRKTQKTKEARGVAE